MLRTHRVMWEIVFGPIPDGFHVLHSCDNPPCANPAHLWLGTQTDNMADMVKKNRQRPCRGEKHGRAKVTLSDVESIRFDSRLLREIAAEFGVSQATVSKIKNGQLWRVQ